MAPNGVTFTRIAIGFMTLALVPAARRPIQRSDWGPTVALGVLWLAFPLSMFPFAEQHVSSALTGMLNGATPLFAAAVASSRRATTALPRGGARPGRRLCRHRDHGASRDSMAPGSPEQALGVGLILARWCRTASRSTWRGRCSSATARSRSSGARSVWPYCSPRRSGSRPCPRALVLAIARRDAAPRRLRHGHRSRHGRHGGGTARRDPRGSDDVPDAGRRADPRRHDSRGAGPLVSVIGAAVCLAGAWIIRYAGIRSSRAPAPRPVRGHRGSSTPSDLGSVSA